MAYVPPHKRHPKDNERRLSPELPPSQTHFRYNPRTKSAKRSSHADSPSSAKMIYAKQAISKWFLVGSDDLWDGDYDENELPSSLRLQPVSLQLLEREKPLILVNLSQAQAQAQAQPQAQPQPQGTHARRSPWELVAAKALQDLLSCSENVRSEMEALSSELLHVRPTLVARFGKIIFHGGPSVAQEAMRQNLASGTTLRLLNRTFYPIVPTLFMEMTTGFARQLGLELRSTQKDLYHVQLYDTDRPDATISCKCGLIKEQNKLKLYKIELNKVRHMVTDVSCIAKNLDLRLMLCSKKILTALKDDEMQCIQNLIESAIIDPSVKGGLRWPLGKDSGERFSVVGACHTKSKAYINSSLRLKVRHADRYDFRKSMGKSASEVDLKLKGIASVIQVQKVDMALISKMLEDTLKLIWDHFLNCDHLLG